MRKNYETLLLPLQAEPSSPPAGWVAAYVDTVDGLAKQKSSAGTVTVLANAASAVSVGQTEVDFGVTSARRGRVTITDAAIVAGQQMIVTQAGDALTGKGTLADENEMDALELRATVTGTGTATVFWSSRTFVKGKFKLNWIVG